MKIQRMDAGHKTANKSIVVRKRKTRLLEPCTKKRTSCIGLRSEKRKETLGIIRENLRLVPLNMNVHVHGLVLRLIGPLCFGGARRKKGA
jgi:hypothetical protein